MMSYGCIPPAPPVETTEVYRPDRLHIEDPADNSIHVIRTGKHPWSYAVYVNGERQKRVTSVQINISPGAVPTVTVTRLLIPEDDAPSD